jgi:hypothetical protein
VPDDIIDALLPVVTLGGGRLRDTGWSVKITQGTKPGGTAFECWHGSLWLISCYMAWDEPGSTEMWQAAMRHPLHPNVQRPLTLPWLAAALMPVALQSADPKLMLEAGDLERCVAWTILHAVGRALSPNGKRC